jgi:hypothetical protein
MRTSNLGWRRGQIIVLAPFMVSVLGGVVAITADVGHMFVEKALLQNTADGAALAATWVLTEQRGAGHSEHDARAAALAEALAIRNANRPEAALAVQFGSWQPGGSFVAAGEEVAASAVHVRALRNSSAPGGALSLSFARLLGMRSCNVAAAGTCEASGFIRGFLGGLRPFAVYEGNIAAIGQMMTFYEHAKVEPGNFGLLDLNGGANGTPDLAQWIGYGYDGEVTLSEDGYLWIDGDPGFRAALKNDIQAVWGEEIYIVVYDQVTGSGSNAHFRCIGFLGIVITSSDLTGKTKYITCRVTGMKSVHDVITGGSWSSPNLRKVQLVG